MKGKQDRPCVMEACEGVCSLCSAWPSVLAGGQNREPAWTGQRSHSRDDGLGQHRAVLFDDQVQGNSDFTVFH